MSITAYVGLPGHGKSYGVVSNVIAESLKNGIEVWTNIPMIQEECDKRFGCHVVPFHLDDILNDPDWFTAVFESGSTIVIDEVWRLWPSGLKAYQVLNQHKSFLAEHRHMVGVNGRSTEVVFVTQDLSQIASFARQLVETTFRVKKAAALGFNKSFRVDVFSGSVTGTSPPLSKREREIHGRFRQDIFDLYQSHTLGTGQVGDETRTDQRFNILSGAGVKIGIASIAVFSWLSYLGFSELSDYYGQVPDEHEIIESNLMLPTGDSSMPLFLSRFDHIYISSYGGIYPDYKLEITIDQGRSVARLNANQLALMGYTLDVISNCLIYITGHDYNDLVLCESRTDTEGPDSFFPPAESSLTSI